MTVGQAVSISGPVQPLPPHTGSPPGPTRPFSPAMSPRLLFSVRCSRGVEFKLGTTEKWLFLALCFGACSVLLLSRVASCSPATAPRS
jgi:hypothetical protein